MNTLFHAELSEREFSSHLLHVGDLLEWAQSKRLHIQTKPAIDGYRFVQVEALLCAIERQMKDLSRDQAAEIIAANPALKNERMAELNPAWLLGADAHQKWRGLLSGAIHRHELTLLDFASKLPIAPAQTPAPAMAASEGPAPLPAVPNWKMRVQAEATALVLSLRKSGASPTKHSILEPMAQWCRDNNVMTNGSIFPSANYLRTHVLGGKHWDVPN